MDLNRPELELTRERTYEDSQYVEKSQEQQQPEQTIEIQMESEQELMQTSNILEESASGLNAITLEYVINQKKKDNLQEKVNYEFEKNYLEVQLDESIRRNEFLSTKYEILQKELDALNKAHRMQEVCKESLSNEINSFGNIIQSIQAHLTKDDELDRLNNSLIKLQEEELNLTCFPVELRKDLQKIKEVERERATLIAMVEQEYKSMEDLKIKMDDLKNEEENLNNVRKAIDQKKIDIAKAEEDEIELQKILVEKEKKCEELRADLEENTNVVTEMEKEISSIKAKNEEEVTKLVEEHNIMAQQEEEIKVMILHLNNQISEKQTEFINTFNETDRIAKENTVMEERLLKIKNEIEELNASNERDKQADYEVLNKLKVGIEITNKNLNGLKEQEDSLKEQMESLSAEKIKYEEVYNKVNSELQEATFVSQDLKEEFQQLCEEKNKSDINLKSLMVFYEQQNSDKLFQAEEVINLRQRHQNKLETEKLLLKKDISFIEQKVVLAENIFEDSKVEFEEEKNKLEKENIEKKRLLEEETSTIENNLMRCQEVRAVKEETISKLKQDLRDMADKYESIKSSEMMPKPSTSTVPRASNILRPFTNPKATTTLRASAMSKPSATPKSSTSNQDVDSETFLLKKGILKQDIQSSSRMKSVTFRNTSWRSPSPETDDTFVANFFNMQQDETEEDDFDKLLATTSKSKEMSRRPYNRFERPEKDN